MYTLLYNVPVVDRRATRAIMRQTVRASALIRGCGDGDPEAVRTMLWGLWPFVSNFEHAIDRKVAALPMQTLIARFGRERTRSYLNQARAAVREMKEEEGSHAALWRDGASELGVALPANESVPGVTALTKAAETDDPVAFFCWLAGTEYVAEEVAAYLCEQPRFLDVFPSRRWTWGEAHTETHEGPSHLELDEDLARAFHPADDDAVAGATITEGLEQCLRLFVIAADDVFEAQPMHHTV